MLRQILDLFFEFDTWEPHKVQEEAPKVQVGTPRVQIEGPKVQMAAARVLLRPPKVQVSAPRYPNRRFEALEAPSEAPESPTWEPYGVPPNEESRRSKIKHT